MDCAVCTAVQFCPFGAPVSSGGMQVRAHMQLWCCLYCLAEALAQGVAIGPREVRAAGVPAAGVLPGDAARRIGVWIEACLTHPLYSPGWYLSMR